MPMRVCCVWFVPLCEQPVSSPRVAAAAGGISHIPGTFRIPSAGGKDKEKCCFHFFQSTSILIYLVIFFMCLCTRMVLMEAVKVNIDLNVSWASSNCCSSCLLCSLAASSLFFRPSKCCRTEILLEKKHTLSMGLTDNNHLNILNDPYLTLHTTETQRPGCKVSTRKLHLGF